LTNELLNVFSQHAGEEDMHLNCWIIKRMLTKDKELADEIEQYRLMQLLIPEDLS
jgi:hypothetical protein